MTKKKTWQSQAWKVLLLLFLLAGVNAYINRTPQVTQEAKDTTSRNAFVSACVSGADKYPTVDAPSYCGCAYNKLIAMYPDFTTNTERLNRITTVGYNSTETDAIVTCLGQSEILQN